MGHPDRSLVPACSGAAERFLATRLARFALFLSIALCLAAFLAGHFNLAFLTVLTLVAYVPLRLFFANRDLPSESCARAKSLGGIVAGRRRDGRAVGFRPTRADVAIDASQPARRAGARSQFALGGDSGLVLVAVGGTLVLVRTGNRSAGGLGCR